LIHRETRWKAFSAIYRENYFKMLSKDFTELFTKRELQEIKGLKSRNTKILVSIFFGTFLAIGISRGGLEYLSLKMNDPFVKNLEVEIPYDKAMLVEDFKASLIADSLKNTYKYDTVLAHVEYPLMFWNNKRKDTRRVKGRSIDFNNPLLKQIIAKRNLVKGHSFSGQFDCGLIVTKRFLDNFGYSENDLFVTMSVAKDEEGYYQVPVPVIAVVKELPSLSSCAFTPYFYKERTSGIDNPYNIRDHRDVSFFVPLTDKKEIALLKKNINDFVSAEPSFKDMDPLVDVFEDKSSYQNGSVVNITFSPEPESVESTDALFETLIRDKKLKKYSRNISRFYFYDFQSNPTTQIAFDKISIVFNSLSKVDEFKEFLFNNYELDIEMSKVREKENFTTISILTYSIATMLLIFSIISMGFFIYNLLKSHLYKIRMNLGTFQAFGMSKDSIIFVYRNIIRKFCLISLLIGYGLAMAVDLLVILLVFPDLSIYQLINIQVLLAVLLIWGIVEYVFYQTTRSILVRTPGDLIYGRD
jgi:hypothetical protein